MCQHENIINRFHRILEIIIAYTNDDVEFAGTLIDHLDVDMGMGKSRENTGCSASLSTHAASYDCDQCKIRL